MKSSSLKHLAKSNVDPAKYRDSIIHEWYLDPVYAENLEVFIIRETTSTAFFDHVMDGEVKIKGHNFSVIWINSPAVCRKTRRLLVSIRYCKHLNRGYALVKVLDGGQFNELEYN